MSTDKHDVAGCWKANVRIIMVCLVVWAICFYGFAILLRPALESIMVGGSDLGFWFGRQGNELTVNNDILVLANSEIANLPGRVPA